MVDLCKANLCVVQEVCGRVVLILLNFEAGLDNLAQALLLFQAWHFACAMKLFIAALQWIHVLVLTEMPRCIVGLLRCSGHTC